VPLYVARFFFGQRFVALVRVSTHEKKQKQIPLLAKSNYPAFYVEENN